MLFSVTVTAVTSASNLATVSLIKVNFSYALLDLVDHKRWKVLSFLESCHERHKTTNANP